MKYFKRSNEYRARNVTFNPEAVAAFSYGWWKFVSKINEKVVFNNFTYSNTTGRHQKKVAYLLESLGIEVDLYVTTKETLGSSNARISSLKQAYWEEDLVKAEKIKEVFQVEMSQDEIDALYVKKEEYLCYQYLKRAIKYQEKKEAEALKKAKELENSADIIHVNFNKGA